MEEKKKKERVTPWGVPRIVIAASYFLVLCVTGMAVGAADPLQEMMKLNGAFAEIEDDAERSSMTGAVISFGISCCVLSGVFVGPVIDVIGAKLTGLLGLALHSAGYLLLFFPNTGLAYYASGVCFGFAFQCILNSHMTVGCLFPRNPNLVLAFIGAAPDLSLFFPPSLYSFSEHYGGPEGVKKTVLLYLLIFIVPAAIIDLLFLPFRPFQAPVSSSLSNEITSNSNEHDIESTPLVGKKSADSAPINKTPIKVPYGNFNLKAQLMTPDYWIFVPFAIITFLRKKHVSVSIRPILQELDSDELGRNAKFYTGVYNATVPYGFIPAIIWGGLVDKYGIISLMFASNSLAVIYTFTSLFSIMPLQAVTVAIFILYQSFVFGQCIAFCASTYGFNTLATLQGICCSLAGACSIFMDFVWPDFVYKTLESNWAASVLILCVSIAMFAFPLTLFILSKFRERRNAKNNITNIHHEHTDDDDTLDKVLPMTNCYDRGSIMLLGQRASLAEKRSATLDYN